MPGWQPARCAAADCEDFARARGWCVKHWKRWRTHGDVTVVQRARNTRPPRFCTAEGCEQKHFAKDYCRIHYARHYYRTNLVKAKAGQAAYRDANRERLRASSREWRKANPDRVRQSVKNYQQRNAAALKIKRREYRNRNRDLIRALNQRHRARKRNAPVNDFTAAQWREIKIAYRYRCAYCHKRRPLTMDHVIALSKGGPHTASNIIPACGSCNSHKSAGPAPTHQPLLF